MLNRHTPGPNILSLTPNDGPACSRPMNNFSCTYASWQHTTTHYNNSHDLNSNWKQWRHPDTWTCTKKAAEVVDNSSHTEHKLSQ